MASDIDQDMSRQDASTTIRPAAQVAEPIARHALFLLTGQRQTQVIDAPLLVGRSIDCDIQTADDASSRVHLQLAAAAGAVRITDLDSGNGTFVDGHQVRGAMMLARGVVRFGDNVALIAAAHDEPAIATDSPLVGGAALTKSRRIVSLIAPTDLPLMITGETGTGKEVVARWAHHLSQRSGPLISVNCAALPESLLEAELFGHVKGAFTGAAQASRGLVAAAASGTLFLDEVGELPLAVQAKLLRVLEDRVVRPIGADGGAGQPIDFRVICATNVDLQAAVARGAFRADLYARLAAVVVATPPLREHIEDLPLLIDHLLRRAGAAATLSPDALEAIARYHWPQNVRQLDFALRRAIALSPACIELEHLPDEVRQAFRKAGTVASAAHHDRVSITREQLEGALHQHRGNVRRVGQALGIPRSRLYRLLAKWSLNPVDHRAGIGMAAARRETP